MGHGRLNSIHRSKLIPGIAFSPLNPSKNTGYVLSFASIEANEYPKIIFSVLTRILTLSCLYVLKQGL
jgi:hypothetical protein